MKISRFISFLLMVLMRVCESDKISMLSIPHVRAMFMAIRTAKASARRGDETCSAVAECWDEVTRSSMIQPNPAEPVEEFQATSV